MYSVIVNSQLIVFPCINLIFFYLGIIMTIHSYMYLIVDTFCTMFIVIY